MSDILNAVAVVVTGPMVGVELSVAAFFNPLFARLPDDAFRAARGRASRVLGAVMPFWYMGTLLVLAVTAVRAWGGTSGWLCGIAAGLMAAVLRSAVLADLFGELGLSRYSWCRSTEDRRSPSNRSKVREHPGGPRRRTRHYRRYSCRCIQTPRAASCAGAFVVPRVITDDTSNRDFSPRRYAWPEPTRPPPLRTLSSSSAPRPRP